MRTDALRRRNAILAAASKAVITNRFGFTAEEVAAAAKVGIATLYRNFPTRQDLTNAALAFLLEGCSTQFEQILAELEAQNSVDESNPEAAEKAIAQTIDVIASLGPNVLGPDVLSPVFDPEAHEEDLFRESRERIVESLRTLDTHYRAAGLIHESVQVLDFINGLVALCGPPQLEEFESTRTSSDTLIAIYLAGCKVGMSTPVVPTVMRTKD